MRDTLYALFPAVFIINSLRAPRYALCFFVPFTLRLSSFATRHELSAVLAPFS